MSTVQPFHSSQETDGNAYHVCSNCVSGKNIKKENKEPGKGGLTKCEICTGLQTKGSC